MIDNDSGTVPVVPTPDALRKAMAFCDFVNGSPTAFHAAG